MRGSLVQVDRMLGCRGVLHRCYKVLGGKQRTKNKTPESVRIPGSWKTGSTGLEPAASDVTGRRSNQLNYNPSFNSLQRV
jgi:hypothetical protein